MSTRFFSILILFLSMTAMAGEIGGKNLPDTLTVGDAELSLNGAGLRKKFFIKVYAGGLYLQEKSKDAKSVVEADQPMAVRLHFIYKGVSAEKLVGAWNEGFENGLGEKKSEFQQQIDQFNGFWSKEAKEDDVYMVTYEPGKGTSVVANDEVIGTIPGLEFKKAVFGIWLGENVSESKLKALKKSMLEGK